MGTTPSTASRSSGQLRAPLPALTPPKHHYSLRQRCVSLYHDVRNRLSGTGLHRWSRRPFRETPIDHLGGLAPGKTARINALQAHYEIRFESHYEQHTAMANYTYLDLLEQA